MRDLKQTDTVAKDIEDAAELKRQSEALAAYVERWTNVSDEEAEEQRETMEYLVKALDEHRPEDRKLFPT